MLTRVAASKCPHNWNETETRYGSVWIVRLTLTVTDIAKQLENNDQLTATVLPIEKRNDYENYR